MEFHFNHCLIILIGKNIIFETFKFFLILLGPLKMISKKKYNKHILEIYYVPGMLYVLYALIYTPNNQY